MGGNEAIIVQILAVVLILFFCFVTYMNTKTWRVTHVIFLFLVFGAAMVFSVYASLILKTRKAWLAKNEQLEKSLGEQQTKGKVLKNGELKIPKETLGLNDYTEAIHREIIDRGRVWRDCVLTRHDKKSEDPEYGDALMEVSFSTIPPENQGEKVEDGNDMQVDTVVYAFKDLSNPPGSHSKYEYIGEFKVTAANETSITMVSARPLLAYFQERVPGNQPWILYETLPVDDPSVFSSTQTLLRPAVQPSEVIRREDYFDDASYNEVLWEHERDGMPIADAVAHRQAKGQPPLEPEELQRRTYAKVKFLKDYSVVVDAPVASSPAEVDVDAFDLSGQALDPKLRRGGAGEPKPVEFKAGDEAIMIAYGFSEGGVTEKGAKDLEREGIVQIEQEIYRRPLNDFAYSFDHIELRRNQIRDALRLVEYELQVVADEIKNAEENNKARMTELMTLRTDREKLVAEKDKIAAYVDKLDAKYRDLRAELSRVYRENVALHEQIVAANQRLSQEIEQRTATPTSVER